MSTNQADRSALVIPPVKVALATGAAATTAGAAVSQLLGAAVPDQIAWVLGGLVAVGSAIAVVLTGYNKFTETVDQRARDRAREVVQENAKAAAEKTEASIAAAIKDHSHEQTAALREHIHAEERKFDAILAELKLQRAQNESIIETVKYLRSQKT
jgi:hypothetical protein